MRRGVEGTNGSAIVHFISHGTGGRKLDSNDQVGNLVVGFVAAGDDGGAVVLRRVSVDSL